jgi:hypothetical protein
MTPPSIPSDPRIGDCIDVPPVQTVIRLDEALRKPREISESFVVTDEVAAHLQVLTGLLGQPTGKGMFLQGDFGSGKSHFLAVLTAWLSNDRGSDCITAAHAGLATMRAAHKRFLPVDISLVHYRAATPLERIIATAIEKRLASQGTAASLSALAVFLQRVKEIIREPAMAGLFNTFVGQPVADVDAWFLANERDAYTTCVRFLKSQGVTIPELLVEERHEVFGRAMAAVRAAGFDGMVLIIDELSEFFRSKADASQINEDARTLQFLGELAGSEPLWIICAVQESIERTGDIAQATFRKIKDRFPIKLHLSTLHIRELIARRLVRRRDGADAVIHRIFADYQSHFRSFSCAWDLFRVIYPVHPVTLALLEGLGELFSQHRGIVDFVHARIAGDPQRGIAGILDRPAAELLAPDSIYDHFESRLLEFSAFNTYPRHIVPHLDEVIGRVIEDDDDRRMARRLVRILVLYAIHPTAAAPDVSRLAEFTGCMLASHDPSVNVKFVAGTLLDPVVENSRFLSKEPAPSGDPLMAVYSIVVREDHTKTLKSRVQRVMSELAADDSRQILDPLAELSASVSWPGPELLRDTLLRPVTWRLSGRQAVVAFVYRGVEKQAANRIAELLKAGAADFAVALVLGDTVFDGEHTAVWRIPLAGDNSTVTREYVALRMVSAELRPSNPADAPLVTLAEEACKRQSQVAQQAVLNLIYAGSFDNKQITIDPAALQMKRFERLLETAAEQLCEERYPRFKEIASRLLPPSPRTYQRLYEEFVMAGSISMVEARNQGLTQAIESIAAPLGIVEVKSGSYRLAPSPAEHPFLSFLFSLFCSSGQTPLPEVLHQLQHGTYGVPHDCAGFILASLANSGLVSLLNHGRMVPLEFLRLSSVDNADAIAPGELIGQAYREMLQAECSFLLATPLVGAFGLRQQRDAWQAVIKLKKTVEGLLAEITTRISGAASYSTFDAFDLDGLGRTAKAFQTLIDEIKVSYSAREGLERFLNTWRTLAISAADLETLKKNNKFFQGSAEHFIFVSLYLRHQSVAAIVRDDPGVRAEYDAVMAILREPQARVVADGGEALEGAFAAFRLRYAECYGSRHGRFYGAVTRPEISRHGLRVVALLRAFAGIGCLDRPAGLEGLLRELDKPPRSVCRRNTLEELLRAPLCGCGFMADQTPPEMPMIDWEQRIAQSLAGYIDILRAPVIGEALAARSHAIKDMQPTLAAQLQKSAAALKQGVDGAALIDLFDDQIVTEIGRALSGATPVENRSLATLISNLSGRRLTPHKIREMVETWIARSSDETIMAIEDSLTGTEGGTRPFTGWWPLLRPDLFGDMAASVAAPELATLERSLEESIDPARIRQRLEKSDNVQLARFIADEPLYTRAMRAAWELLASRVFNRATAGHEIVPGSRHLVKAEAGACVKRLETLHDCSIAMMADFPARLMARINCAEVIADSWASTDLQALASGAIETIAAAGADWLASLPPVTPVDLAQNPFVCILDGVSPDIWLKAADVLQGMRSRVAWRWERNPVASQTVPAINHLLGFPAGADPVEVCASRGILYHHQEGTAAHPIVNLIPPLPANAPVVVRISAIDRGSHDQSLRLCDMPQVLIRLLADNLPGLLDVCNQSRRPFVLTSDHGMSLLRKRLTHGRGGVFEEAVFRAEWDFR